MSAIFVGRAREMRAFDELLAQAGRGAGRLALLSGEPGIGKTRLAEEVARRAEERGFLVAWGRSWEGSGTPAYWPWTQVLRRLAAAAALAPAFVDAELRQLVEPTALEAPAPPDPEHARFAQFDAVARGLARAAAVRPLALVLDDLHAADAATVALLRFVARGLHGTAILIVATMRDAAFASGPQVPAALTHLSREARHVPLARLTEDETGEWVAQVAPGLEAARVWTVSEGNPLFVEELLAAARRTPGAARAAGRMPLGIREALRANLDLVPARALGLLEVASVLGREVSRASLDALAAGDAGDAGEAAAALDEALASGVLLDAGEGRLRFSHVLLRDELYARLPAERKGALHRQAARVVGDPATAAHHALEGARPEDAPAALALVQAAMRAASSRLAHEDAARLAERAIARLGAHLPPAEVCELMVAAGEALVLAGEVAAGQEAGARAADRAAELGLHDQLARGALTRAAGLTFIRDEPAVALLRRALEALPEGDSALRALVMGRLAAALLNAPADRDEQRRLRDGAIAMARRLRDERALLTSLYSASGSYPEEMAPRERFALYAETLQLAERLGAVGRIAPLLSWHVVSWLELGLPDGAREAAARVEGLLEPFTQPHFRWRPPLIRAVLAMVGGRFAEAERLARASLAVAQEHADPEGLTMYCVFRSGLPYLRGDDGGLGDVLGLVDAILGRAPLWNTVFRAIVDAPLGRAPQVRACFARLAEMSAHEVTGAAQLGWACARIGDAEHAGLFYDLVSRLESRAPIAFGPGGFTCLGPTSLLLGQLAALTGRRDEAAACLARAVALGHELRSPPFIAQAELAWAELLAPIDRAGAAAHARAAQDQAEAMGLAALAERSRALASPAAPGATAARARPIDAEPEDASITLVREGETWVIEGRGATARLRHSKGLGYLDALVRQPHREIHALELVGLDEAAGAGDAGPLLDVQAKQAYRARAEGLRSELDEAAAHNDPERAARIRRELDDLDAELARALGLGGRDRRAASAAERARINVQRRLRDAIRRVAAQDEGLGRHLEASVRTGLFCMYGPTWPPA